MAGSWPAIQKRESGVFGYESGIGRERRKWPEAGIEN
jgi:hypothetical protein